jgi:hypothetical protein
MEEMEWNSEKKVERGNTDTGRQQTPKMELY